MLFKEGIIMSGKIGCKYTTKQKKLLETIERRQRQTRAGLGYAVLFGIWLFLSWILFWAFNFISGAFVKTPWGSVDNMDAQFVLIVMAGIIGVIYTIVLFYYASVIEEAYGLDE